MSGDDSGRNELLRRFLAPAHALGARSAWHAKGRAGTAAVDAVCEIYLWFDGPVDGSAVKMKGEQVEEGRIVDAAFRLYGPPVVMACADWLCEQLAGRTIAAARGLSTQVPEPALEQALALAPEERYSALLVFDAMNNAIANLES